MLNGYSKQTLFTRTALAAVFAFLFLIGCGKELDHEPQLDLGDFAPLVARFEQGSDQNGAVLKVLDLRIRFGKMDSPYDRGICEIIPGETPTIILKKSAWDLLTEEEQEALLFHEMGHCVLRRNHNSEKTSKGVPVSLMYPYALDRTTYLHHQKQYMSELVSKYGEF
ncbi:MAG TPA: hypothetical protein DCS07_04290 [Bdellovibrionales bacterium]|nr:MAG: hypothetical protein A2Z97_15760 [Bdellovibrionales bacterium GWB1_52_6]OFZ06432.1 MAG: hypothetical protein A2X97_03155 [Bdellovibrionales bacterium GWA1_52_35]HAR41838.1 hypothetical protein [Bdellovibrionales bacterium]HCM40191.1 hypothetical protein [Bdellovibrionales bacterium]